MSNHTAIYNVLTYKTSVLQNNRDYYIYLYYE